MVNLFAGRASDSTESEKIMHDAFQCLPDLKVHNDPETGLDISYRDSGPASGPTLVFLHGFNGSSKSWAYQFARFAAKARVVATDFPGYGGSSAGAFRMDQVADLLDRFLRSIGVSRCIVIGHSMGGMLAQVLACRHRELITGVVLSCTHVGYGLPADTPLGERYTSRIEERQRLNDREFGELRIVRMVPDLKDRRIIEFLEEIAGEIGVDSITSGGTAMQQLDTSDILPGLTQPCLILTADLDRVATVERTDFLRAAVQHARHQHLKNVGHAPYAEDAEAFNHAVNTFIADLVTIA